MSFNDFLQNNFNDDTISKQIGQQERIIAQAEKEIRLLQKTKEEQQGTAWYNWNGVKFQEKMYDSCNRYRDQFLGTQIIAFYEDFISRIIENNYEDRGNGGDIDFIIISPTGEEHILDSEEMEELPLLKEYLLRKELKEKYKRQDQQIEDLERKVSSLDHQIQQTEKYTSLYIAQLENDRHRIQYNLNGLKEMFLTESEYGTQLQGLNKVLEFVDELLEKNN